MSTILIKLYSVKKQSVKNILIVFCCNIRSNSLKFNIFAVSVQLHHLAAAARRAFYFIYLFLIIKNYLFKIYLFKNLIIN